MKRLLEWLLDALYGPVCYEFKVEGSGSVVEGSLKDLVGYVINEEQDFLLDEDWSVNTIRMKWKVRKNLPEHDGW